MTMRERMARAGHKALGHKQKFEHCPAAYRNEISVIVDAILAEMETPSEDVCREGVESAIVGFGKIKSQDMGDAASCFSAMTRATREGK